MTSMAMGQQEDIWWRSALRQKLHAERFYWRTIIEDVKEFVSLQKILIDCTNHT